MVHNNTPPASPREMINDLLDDDIDEDLEDGDIVEVIDLDEGEDVSDSEEPINEDEMPLDNSILVFKEHKDSVFTVDVQPNADKPMVASGAQDDVCLIWDLESGNVIKKIDGFKDSVTHVKFNHDGSFLAAADMAGNVVVLKTLPNLVQEPVIKLEATEITWMDWHPGANVLFAGTEDSLLWMWKIPSGQQKIFQGHGEKVEQVKIMPDGKRAVVAYADGSFRIFDLKTEQVLHNVNAFPDKLSICAIDVKSDNQLIAVGSVEGEVKIFNSQNGKNLGGFLCSKRSEGDDDSFSNAVESILFSAPELNTLVVATLDGTVSVWDVSTHVAKVSTKISTGVVKLAWRSGFILAATLDGVTKLVDPRSGQVLLECSGHLEQILDLALTKDLKFLVSSSDDSTCRVYNIEKLLEEAK